MYNILRKAAKSRKIRITKEVNGKRVYKSEKELVKDMNMSKNMNELLSSYRNTCDKFFGSKSSRQPSPPRRPPPSPPRRPPPRPPPLRPPALPLKSAGPPPLKPGSSAGLNFDAIIAKAIEMQKKREKNSIAKRVSDRRRIQ